MSSLQAIEIKAFVPARDFALSQRFYADLASRSGPKGVVWPISRSMAALSCCRTSSRPRWRTTWSCMCSHIGQNTPGFRPVGLVDGVAP